MTSSSVSVNDTVKAIVPSGSTLRAGYEYPASTQTSGAFVNIQNSLGTYTKTFSGPFLPCQMRAKFNFIAGSYTENKVLKTRMNISGGTGYRTITASDVNNHQIAVEMVGLALSILATPNAANAGCRKSGASHFFDSLASLGRGPSAPCPRDGLSKGKAAGGRFSLRQTLPPPPPAPGSSRRPKNVYIWEMAIPLGM